MVSHRPRGRPQMQTCGFEFPSVRSHSVFNAPGKDCVSAGVFKSVIHFVFPACIWSYFSAGLAYCCLPLSSLVVADGVAGGFVWGKLTYQSVNNVSLFNQKSEI